MKEDTTKPAPSQSRATGRKKVLCVTSYALGDDAASWRALNVANALRELGYAVQIYQYVRHQPSTPPNVPGGKLREVPRTIVASSRAACFVRHLHCVAHEGHDLVIGNNINGALFSLLGRLRVPLVLDMHGDMVAELAIQGPATPGLPAIRHCMRLAAYKLADLLTCRISSRISCVSRTMMAVLYRRGIPEQKLLYAPNCVDLELFRPPSDNGAVFLLRDRLGIARNKLVFGYVGRFHKWQGAESFIAAARAADDPELAFLLVGAGETRREGSLWFVREVPVHEILEYYAACDVLVLPRPRHPATEVAAPTKFAEYTAMGKPILTTDVGDAAELVRKHQCGVVVRDNSVTELHGGIRQMKSCRGEALAAMGRAARRLAEEEFNFEITKRSLSQCIDELTGGAAQARQHGGA